MDAARLLVLHRRARECLDTALASLAAGRPEHVDLPVRAARDLLAYLENKSALEADDADLTSSPFPNHD